MFQWENLGRIFDPTEFADTKWMHEFGQGLSSLVFDDFVRVYFSVRPKPNPYEGHVRHCAYVDLDRRNLFRVLRVGPGPVLELGELGTFDEFGTGPLSVIRDGDDINAYYGGWTRCESVSSNVAIGYAISRDGGETFARIGKGPVLSYSPGEPFVLSDPKIRKYGDTWRLWYVAGRKWLVLDGKPEPVCKIRMASSPDGIRWTKWNRDTIADVLGEDEGQASPDVIFSGGRYHMFFCYRQVSALGRNKERSYRIGYAFSDDLVNWTRDDSRVGIDVSEAGWPSEGIASLHVLELDGSRYLLYAGNQAVGCGFSVARLKGALGDK